MLLSNGTEGWVVKEGHVTGDIDTHGTRRQRRSCSANDVYPVSVCYFISKKTWRTFRSKQIILWNRRLLFQMGYTYLKQDTSPWHNVAMETIRLPRRVAVATPGECKIAYFDAFRRDGNEKKLQFLSICFTFHCSPSLRQYQGKSLSFPPLKYLNLTKIMSP